MKKEKKVWAAWQAVLCVCTLSAGISSPSIAQQDTTTIQLDEVVITATKFAKASSETGKVLTIVTRELLDQSGGKDLAQVLNAQAGIIVNGANSNPGKDKSVYLRGAASEYTLILLDGVPVSDPSGISGSFDLRLLPIDVIERIEILKGSQSTLYGSDAVAGVINIITKKGADKPIGGFGQLSGGSYQTGKVQAGINGKLKKFDYTAGYTYLRTDGISEAKDSTGSADFDKDGFSQHALNVNVGVQATEKLLIRPFLRYTEFDGKYDGGAFTDDTEATYKAKLLNTGLSAEYQLAKGGITFQYALDRTNRNYDNAFGGSAFEGIFNHGELFGNYSIAKNLQVLAGISYQHFNMMDTTATLDNPEVNLVSPYASLFVNNLKGFSLEVGGRYNKHSQYGSNYTYSINPSFLVQKKVKLFVNYSTGFKAPTLYQLYGQYGHNENLKPERSRNLEGGIQTFLLDNTLNIRVVLFDRDIKDAILYTYNPGYINLNRQQDQGIEIEPTFQLNNKLTLRAYYTYVTGKVTTKAGEQDTTYFNLIRRPKHNVGAHIGYQITPSLFISTDFKTFGKRTDLFFDPANNYESKEVNMDAYALWDVYVSYSFFKKKLLAFAQVNNLLNSDYMEAYGFATQGTNVQAGIRVNL
ncbi:TonB-dependent receptor [Rhodocytophaga rosea]|uniref:TonB-dependent receptor n=1 Tax=Rhodocytophaga rosea TaxID=2704465 RepID=A0A6C0GSG4_9BACT|nr:TonB-dependent receptor [Rhodocytophaga rosea]QHT71065.1 TonB-dependent receptor [Rhodocytophaga rosea]